MNIVVKCMATTCSENGLSVFDLDESDKMA